MPALRSDFPDIPVEAMSGGEFSVAGAFVSIGTLRVIGSAGGTRFYRLRGL